LKQQNKLEKKDIHFLFRSYNFDKQEVSEQALLCGMNDVIIKPFEQSKLFQIKFLI